MIDIHYRRILFFQAVFLSALGISLYFFLKNSIGGLPHYFWFKYSLVWITFIIFNLAYIKFFALPTKTLVHKLRPSLPSDELSWSIIEESVSQNNDDFLKQKKALEEEYLKYKTILDNLPEPVFILKKNLIILYSNQAFKNLFSIADNEFPIPLLEITRNLEFQDFLTEAVSKGKSRIDEFSFNQLQDPYKNYFDIKLIAISEDDSFLCHMHDCTERKQAAIIREDFVSNFSHEVRTPLTILNGQTQILKNSLINHPDYQEKFGSLFEKIDNNSRRLIRLFNDLLQLSSIERCKEVKKEMTDIEPIVSNIIDEISFNYPTKKILFDLKLESKNFYIDYNLFEQALINLIDNAFKYSPQNAQVTVASSRIKLNGEDYDQLEIADNGIGIHEDQIHRIFERFFRADTSRSNNIEGTGIGLSIVKHIIHKHDGKIKVTSKTGEGTRFIVYLPTIN